MVAGSTLPSELVEELGSLRQRAELLLGRTIGGRWKLETLLGVGGSACVFAACHRNGRRAAVKVAHSERAQSPVFRRRFLSEGYAANRVGHEGAVAILDDGEEADGTIFLVMELLSGKSLAQRLETEGPLPERDVIAAGIGILHVLAAAHDRAILHRDIKPSNVFVTDGGSIKVLDFGSARLHQDEGFPTRSGTILGTPAFMAPELASGQLDDVAACTDIWAVGATLFQLLTGEIVHLARTSNEALVVAATKPARSVLSTRPGVSPALAAIVDRALSFAPGARWPNAKAMCLALTKFQGEEAPSESMSVSPEGPSTFTGVPVVKRRVRLRWQWVVLVVLVLGVVALTLRAWRARRESAAPRAVATTAAPVLRLEETALPAPSQAPAPAMAAPPESSASAGVTAPEVRSTAPKGRRIDVPREVPRQQVQGLSDEELDRRH